MKPGDKVRGCEHQSNTSAKVPSQTRTPRREGGGGGGGHLKRDEVEGELPDADVS